jgi:hypothetical protein
MSPVTLANLRRQLEHVRVAMPEPSRPRDLNSEEVFRACEALVDELAAAGISPRASLGSDKADVARALAELNGATP